MKSTTYNKEKYSLSTLHNFDAVHFKRKVQALLLWLVGDVFAQHQKQPTPAALPGADFRNFPAAAAPYGGGYDAYASLFQNSPPYNLRYDAVDQFNNRQYPTELDGVLRPGLNSYSDVRGIYRQMNYADALQGFRATAPGVRNNAPFNAAPTIPPTPTRSAQEAAAAAYGPRNAVPNAASYDGYGQPARDPYALAAGGFEYAPFGSYNYRSSQAAPGGLSYSSFTPYGPTRYAAAFTPGVSGASAGYGSGVSAPQRYQRR
ncbi:hypothetical protein MTO96_015130 [Rhipicephalus appendiculatus]